MIELDPRLKRPLYEQLYAALADEIRTGQRAPGTPLPGRRTMAAQQGVSVNTVDAAYQMLAAEGLAEPRPRSGFYVQKTYGMLHSRARRAPRWWRSTRPRGRSTPTTRCSSSTPTATTSRPSATTRTSSRSTRRGLASARRPKVEFRECRRGRVQLRCPSARSPSSCRRRPCSGTSTAR